MGSLATLPPSYWCQSIRLFLHLWSQQTFVGTDLSLKHLEARGERSRDLLNSPGLWVEQWNSNIIVSSHEMLALQLMNCGASAHSSHGRRTSTQPFLLKCVRCYAKIEVCKEKLYTLALSSKTQTIWREEGLRCAQVWMRRGPESEAQGVRVQPTLNVSVAAGQPGSPRDGPHAVNPVSLPIGWHHPLLSQQPLQMTSSPSLLR